MGKGQCFGPMNELISVVVPVYNAEKFLDRCMESILGQTYSELEIILVNDGSTDNSGSLCEGYAEKDNRVRVIHKENGGSSSARNRGIEAASGAYIGFVDSDDYLEPSMYQLLIKVLQDEKAVMAQVMSSDFDEAGNLIKGPYRDSGNVTYITRVEMFRLLMLHVGDSSFCTKLIQGDFMRQYRFPENRLNEDFELILDMLPNIAGVYSVETSQYNIELRGLSNSRGHFKKILYEPMIDNSTKAYHMMERYYPECREEAVRFFYVQRLQYLLHMPIHLMSQDNQYYVDIIKDIRQGRGSIRRNQFLTKKQKNNLLMLSIAPKTSKRVHGVFMKLKGK